ncbi:unnamed protein product [Euphydryas editha]|uniref:Uncharacterized protein n=1 Tax=Euphydryas editha TaxID=104508 RepID=A0AAU9TTT6_EUPED|nr:unnamed protein product [Euphydryas editha]
MSYDSQISEFQDIFNPQIYGTVIKSLRIVANWDITTMTFKTPAVASNLATLVTKCCKKFRTECIKIQDEQRKKLAENFLLLWQEEVPVLINKKALENQFDKRQSKKIVLPSKEDVKRLYDYLNNECNICLEILKDEFNFNAWKLLTQCTLISIQIFNRRRAGEIERLLIANYQTKQDLTEHIDKELYKKLADTTKNFAKQFVRLTIRGKRGRPVSVLLNPLAVNCIDTILAYREQANVSSNNEFIFSVPGNNDTAKKYIRECPLMRRFSNDCGAAMPSTLRGTTLRKHVATYTSLLNVEDCQIDKLANFMGHAKEIHKSYYQVPVPISEITEVSKMLIAALGDDEEEDILDGNEEDSESDENSESSADEDEDTDYVINSKNISRNDYKDGSSDYSQAPESTSQTIKKRKIVRRRWTTAEKNILIKQFGRLSKITRLPSLVKCAELIKKNPILHDRTPAQIKTFINNQKGCKK